MEKDKIEILEAPKGCLEINGFILVLEVGKYWITQDGKATSDFDQRGIWETAEESNEARNNFFPDE